MRKNDFNEQYGYDEVTLTRNELADAMTMAVCKILDEAPSELASVIIELGSAFAAYSMREIFDEGKNEKLEVEK